MPDHTSEDRLWAAFDELAELSESDRRAELARIGAEDPDLARELGRMLEPPSDFLAPLFGTLRPTAGGRRNRRDERDPDGAGAPDREPASDTGVVIAGRYALGARVGAGSMGAVYRGEHLKLKKSVAVKLLHPGAATSDEALARAVAEASAAARVRHPNAIAVHDVGVHGDRAYLVMDWVDGVDLQRWLHHASEDGSIEQSSKELVAFVEAELGGPVVGPLWSRPYSEIVAHVVARTARAAEAAHATGLVHRDVAPKNILLTADGTPCLVDFGVASLCEETRTTDPAAAGTLPYMAPEQLESGRVARRPAVDVYGLGATLYHLLAGRPPFSGEGLVLYGAIRRSLPTALRTLRPDVPRDLDAICFAAMEKSPARRYASAEELAADLEAFLDRRPVSRRPPSALGRAARACQRRPAAAVALAALGALLIVGFVAGVLVWQEVRRQRAESEHQRFAELFASLPALTTLESNASYEAPPHPTVTDADLGPVWKELVELKPDQPLLWWYWANWSSQHGELDDAREALDSLRDGEWGSEVFEVLAAALTSADPIVRNQLVKPGALPDASSGFDHALRGYVAYRWRAEVFAWTELSAAIAKDDQWTYRDLRALTGLDLERIADVPAQDAALVEAELGLATRRTLHVRAYLLSDNDPAWAKELWGKALEERPDQHQPLHGLGLLAVREARFGDARKFLRHAAEVKPGSWRSFIMLARCAESELDFDGAVSLLEEGFEDLLEGRPEASMSEQEILLELASVHAAWANDLALHGAEEEARSCLARSDGFAAQLQDLGQIEERWKAELKVMRFAIRVRTGELSAEEAIAGIRAQRLRYVQETAGEDSPVIQANLGLLLYAQVERRAEAEVLLELARRDPVVRSAVEAALEGK
ncbi:MAG: serine/threonine protein kinase [bacterium]|nr:serine/threonine protein kinase [bacterium]